MKSAMQAAARRRTGPAPARMKTGAVQTDRIGGPCRSPGPGLPQQARPGAQQNRTP